MKYLHREIFILIVIFYLSSAISILTAQLNSTNEPVTLEMIEVDSVWAANGVRFDMKTVGELQFIVYYDRNRMMTVASRNVNSNQWIKKSLPNQLIWDSHNSVKLGIDELGYIHVSGNQHVDPLAYYRSSKPYDVTSMQELNEMVGNDEESVTYPSFFNDKSGKLLFSYRSGSCGNGNILINRFNPHKGKWERYLKQPLFEGIEKTDTRAAYHHWVKDSKGDFHFAWMWRWTPMVETSHHICYAKTSDLKNWKNINNEPVSLPFTPDDSKVLVDNTPSKGGLHNSRYKLMLDNNDEPIIGYTKYDEEGLTQFYLARHIGDVWVSKKISDWDFRWKFIDGGAFMSMGGQFNFVGLSDDGILAIDWTTEKGDAGQYIIDINTFEHSDKMPNIRKLYPEDLYDKISSDPDMRVRLAYDKRTHEKTNSRYVLKWEAEHGGFRKHAPKIIPKGPLSPLLLLEFK